MRFMLIFLIRENQKGLLFCWRARCLNEWWWKNIHNPLHLLIPAVATSVLKPLNFLCHSWIRLNSGSVFWQSIGNKNDFWFWTSMAFSLEKHFYRKFHHRLFFLFLLVCQTFTAGVQSPSKVKLPLRVDFETISAIGFRQSLVLSTFLFGTLCCWLKANHQPAAHSSVSLQDRKLLHLWIILHWLRRWQYYHIKEICLLLVFRIHIAEINMFNSQRSIYFILWHNLLITLKLKHGAICSNNYDYAVSGPNVTV